MDFSCQNDESKTKKTVVTVVESELSALPKLVFRLLLHRWVYFLDDVSQTGELTDTV